MLVERGGQEWRGTAEIQLKENVPGIFIFCRNVLENMVAGPTNRTNGEGIFDLILAYCGSFGQALAHVSFGGGFCVFFCALSFFGIGTRYFINGWRSIAANTNFYFVTGEQI